MERPERSARRVPSGDLVYPGAQGCTGKKRLRPAVKRQMVTEMITDHGLPERRACGLMAKEIGSEFLSIPCKAPRPTYALSDR